MSYAVKSRTADRWLTRSGLTGPLEYGSPGHAYPFTRAEADRLALAHDGIVTTRPFWDGVGYAWLVDEVRS